MNDYLNLLALASPELGTAQLQLVYEPLLSNLYKFEQFSIYEIFGTVDGDAVLW